jgi:hypothetical protein
VHAPGQPFGFQDVECLGCGGLGAAPLLGDPVDRRQRVTGLQFPAVNALPQVSGDAQVGRFPGAMIIYHTFTLVDAGLLTSLLYNRG